MTITFRMGRILGLLLAGLLLMQLIGCATTTSSLECGVETMNPTVMGAIDSFESAALAIKLSNQVLLEMPISEQESWPELLYGAPSGLGMFKMGLSLFASSQGITAPLEIDPQTGLPRPTSALYIFLKEREQMLAKEASREDLAFFRSQPPQVIARQIPFKRRKPNLELIDEHIYRNPLMAFGVVTANRAEMVRVQQDIDLLAKGFKQCDAWVHASREGDVKPAACQDPALKQDALQARMNKASFTEDKPVQTPPPEPAVQEPQPVPPPMNLRDAVGSSAKAGTARSTRSNRGQDTRRQPVKSTRSNQNKANEPAAQTTATTTKRNIANSFPAAGPEQAPKPAAGVIYITEKDRQVGEKTEELEVMQKNYGKLAGRVYKAAVAGADFSMSAMVKIGCAIVNGTRALPNIQNEFKGARGAYNIVMVVSRVKMIISAFGYYKDNLGLQYTAYTTMYQQIKGTYPELKDDEPVRDEKTAQALQRIELARAEWRHLEPKLLLLAQGEQVNFTDDDLARISTLSRLYPDHQSVQQDFLLALNQTAPDQP